MVDIKLLREDPEKYKKGTAAKQLDPSLVDEWIKLDERRRLLISDVEHLRAERNKVSKKRTEESVEEGRKIKLQLKKFEPELKDLDEKYNKILRLIPNPPADDVKEGKDDSENETVKKWGEPRKFNFEVKDHLDLGETLGIIDVERAAKVSGTRFGYLKGDGVMLEFALVQFAMEMLMKEGFTPVIPPTLIKKEMMAGMGYMEHGGEDDMYVLDKDNLVLVATSEQSIGPMHSKEVLEKKNMPKRYAGFSSCFRREAGTYGKDTRGILRVHQFDKVEMFSFAMQEEGDKEHEMMLSMEESISQALEIPYQVVKMCSGDLGLPAARKYDIDAWMPGQNAYKEITSTSQTTDYQSRRLNIKYKDGVDTKYAHMLNGTAIAIGRTIVAIMENYQQEDGSIEIPKVLQKWMGKDKITSPNG